MKKMAQNREFFLLLWRSGGDMGDMKNRRVALLNKLANLGNSGRTRAKVGQSGSKVDKAEWKLMNVRENWQVDKSGWMWVWI